MLFPATIRNANIGSSVCHSKTYSFSNIFSIEKNSDTQLANTGGEYKHLLPSRRFSHSPIHFWINLKIPTPPKIVWRIDLSMNLDLKNLFWVFSIFRSRFRYVMTNFRSRFIDRSIRLVKYFLTIYGLHMKKYIWERENLVLCILSSHWFLY